MKKTRLPDKPSELLKLALTDLELVEKDHRYTIDMFNWHSPVKTNISRQCQVCLAGAVLAKTCGVSPKRDVSINYGISNNKLKAKLLAINDFRKGYIMSALIILNVDDSIIKMIPDVISDEDIGLYNKNNLDDMSEFNRERWKPYMIDLIGMLEAHGI